jgi:outer membrane immunogenic protein
MTVRLIALPLLLLGFATAAIADETHSLPGGEVSSADWSGVFVGVHGGYARSSTDWVLPFDQYYNFGLGGGQSFSTDAKDKFFGGHLLWNYQRGHFVIGVEAAFSGGTLRDERIGAVSSLYPEDQLKTSIADPVTLSGRVGFAFADWLLYAKGGLATAEVTLDALSGPPGAGVEATMQARRSGRRAGGGVEYMIAPRLALGLEYSFTKFDAGRFSTVTTGTQPGLPITVDLDDIALHSVTARLSLRLGPALLALETLK